MTSAFQRYTARLSTPRWSQLMPQTVWFGCVSCVARGRHKHVKSSTRARERRYVEERSEGDTPPPHSHQPHPATHHHPHTTSVKATCHIWIRACYMTPPTTDPRPPSPPYPHPTRTIPSPTLAPLPLLPPSPSLPPTLDIHHRHTHHVPCSGCSGSHQLGPAPRRNSRGHSLLPRAVQ